MMRMPGEAQAEFLLLQPMVPIGRPNMIAWVAARSDAPNYGATRVYRFPAETTVFGPTQIEARIDQDPIISQQISLWNQSGSKVIRGNLIVVPLGDSIIYLQPVYLQSTGVAFPEFQRIVVASTRNVVWAPTLGGAVRPAARGRGRGGRSPAPTPGPVAEPGSIADARPRRRRRPARAGTRSSRCRTTSPGLIAYANRHFDLAQAALRAGDFAGYGHEIGMVKAALDELDAAGPGLGLGPEPRPARRSEPMGATLAGSLLVTLARPSTWVLALAAFLIRGGLLVFVIPIVVLPTPVGLAERRRADARRVRVRRRLARRSSAVVATASSGRCVWLVGGGLLAATAEAELIRIVATDEDVTPGIPLPDGVGDGRRRGPHPRSRASLAMLAVRRRAGVRDGHDRRRPRTAS